MLKRLAVLYLLAWIPLFWQPLWGQAPSAGVESGHNQEQQREFSAPQSQDSQNITKKMPLFIYIHDAPIGKDDAAEEQHENDRKRFTEVFNLILAFAVAVFTGLLVAVGYFGVRAANRTLGAIKDQAGLMKEQLAIQEASMQQWVDVETRGSTPKFFELTSRIRLAFGAVNNTNFPLTLQKVITQVNIRNKGWDTFVSDSIVVVPPSGRDKSNSVYTFAIEITPAAADVDLFPTHAMLSIKGEVTFRDCLNKIHVHNFNGYYSYGPDHFERLGPLGMATYHVKKDDAPHAT
jgi:hypothetical protein